MKLIHTYKRVLARNDALHSLYYPIQYLHTLHCKVKCVLSRFAEKQIHYVTQYIENYRMNGNLDNASADSTIGRNKKSFQVSQNGNYREGRPNLRSSSSNALRRMSNTIITQPRFRRRPNKLNNGLTSTKSSPRSLRFEVEEEVTSETSNTSFERFCHCTSLHGWKYLSSSVNFTLRIGWIGVVIGDTNDAL